MSLDLVAVTDLFAEHSSEYGLTTWASRGLDANDEPLEEEASESVVRLLVQPATARETVTDAGTTMVLLAVAFSLAAIPAGGVIEGNGERYRILRCVNREGVFKSELVAP
jgi:hypothetical protein